MDAVHGMALSAVVTRLHDVSTSAEKSGGGGGSAPLQRNRELGGARGRVHAAGRQHKLSYMTVVDAAAGGQGEKGNPVLTGGTGAPHGVGAEIGGIPGRGQEKTVEDATAAFTAYVQERRASLYAAAYHLTGDRFEAEDLLQSALFSTYRAWDRISDKAAVGGYLRRTMTNLHISAWRRRKLNEYPTEELPETAGGTDAMSGTELRAVLWQALARLPEIQRTMLVLRYYEGRTDPEIADILNISVGTVKSSIWRSLRRLREDDVLSFGRDEEESFGELVA
jgi:RNA polymerase sigma-70 factor (sigma-E family)